MYKTKKLSEHPAAQCKINIFNNGDIDFISYSTRVISVKHEDNNKKIECTGLYSMTTRKQITWFLREYFPELSFDFIKSIAGSGFTPLTI